MHEGEQDVIRYAGEKDVKQKKQILQKLRNLGSHLHNTQVLKEGKGELLVVYRSKRATGKGADNYVPCTNFAGYFNKRQLWKHVKKCTGKHTKGRKHVSAGKLMLPSKEGVQGHLHTVVQCMVDYEIKRVVKNDSLILKFGEKLCRTAGHNRAQHNHIRNAMRELGRLLVVLREQLRIMDLEQAITPQKFPAVVEAVQIVSGYDTTTSTYKTPSLAKKLGTRLAICAGIMNKDAMIELDDDKVKRAKSFSKLISIDWASQVSSNALRNLYEAKKNNIALVPLTEDVRKLSALLRGEIYDAIKEIATCFTQDSYKQL